MARVGFEKDIFCPWCGSFLKHYKGWGWTAIQAKCKKCKKLVTYDHISDTYKVDNLPQRSSSGQTFY